jgi:hypothetical protein
LTATSRDMRRLDSRTPYAVEHSGSVARSMVRERKPRSLAEYLRWFADRWQAEMPTEIHSSGVWRDRVTNTEAKAGVQATGGSHLGSPRLNEAFRRLLENSPFETEHAVYEGHQQPEPHYVRPIHAAITRMSHKRPLTAHWLASLAASGFDWQGLVTRRGWSLEEGELYLEGACYLLFREFDIEPRTREYREAIA